jgi:hypothetical protein
MDQGKYGPLALIVALAGNLGAAAVALRIAFAGKLIWEPKVQNFNKAPTRIVNVFVIIGIAIMFFATRSQPGMFPTAYWAIGFGIVLFVFFLADVALRTKVIVTCENTDISIIGGFWLTRRAREILRGEQAAYDRGDLLIDPETGKKQEPPTSVTDFFCNGGRNVELTWTAASRVLANVTSVFVYCIWLAGACLAVAASSIVLEKAIAGQ